MSEMTEEKIVPGLREPGERKVEAAAQKLIICQGTTHAPGLFSFWRSYRML